MVSFQPFKALMPALKEDERIEDRASPPYDVIGEEERAALQSKPFNVARITLGAKEGRYEDAARELAGWIKTGRLAKSEKEAFYIYRQTFELGGKSLTRTGIVGRLRCEPYSEGNIMPHEETFPKVKEDRLNLLKATSAHLESIFGIYDGLDERSTASIQRHAAERFRFQDGDGVTHSLSVVDDPGAVKDISSLLASKKVLIADGHHRYETALRYSTENPSDDDKAYVLATLVAGDDPGLVVEPTHRLVRTRGAPIEDLLNASANDFGVWEMRSAPELETVMARSKRIVLGLLLPDGRSFALEHIKAPDDNPLWSVDAFVCEELVLKPMAAAREGEAPEIEYDHDLDSVRRRIASEGFDLAIVLSAPRMGTIWKVAKAGKKMPKKSTYFYPKVWSGLVLYPMA